MDIMRLIKQFCPSCDACVIAADVSDSSLDHMNGLAKVAMEDFPGLLMVQIRPYRGASGAIGIEFDASTAFGAVGRGRKPADYQVVSSHFNRLAEY